ALAIDPNFENALTDKGNALNGLGNYKQAIQYYDKALAIDPNNKDALDGKQSALSHTSNGATNNAGGNMTASSSTNSAAAPLCDPRHSLC
ncbi:MAG: tetratricopeptide repeat protein, partial [Candidatus Nitrosopolaris sp.]